MLVKACLNGSREPGEHPAVPITVEDLAAAAAAAVGAGAGAVHVHPRAEDGSQTLEPGPCGKAVTAIREACPGTPVGVSTAAWIAPHPERLRLIEAWDPLPDFASVNVSEGGSVELMELLEARGIGIEAGLAGVEDAEWLIDLGLARRCLRVLVEVDEEEHPGWPPVDLAAAIDETLDRGGVDAPRLHHGFGLATWDVLRAAVERGRDVRTGLEDTLVLADGRIARDNAELVAEALRIARDGGRTVAVPRREPGG